MVLRKGIVIALVAVVMLSGCAWWGDLWRHEMAKNTPDALYKTGYDYYQDGLIKKQPSRFKR